MSSLKPKSDLTQNKLTLTDRYATHTGPTGVQTTYDMAKIAKTFYKEGKLELGLLPPVVRYLSPDFTTIIIERPPTTQTIAFKNAHKAVKGVKADLYTIPIPWQVYLIRLGVNKDDVYISSLAIYFRKSQIWGEDDELYRTYLPNMWNGQGTVCTGVEPKAVPIESTTVAQLVNEAIAQFWSSEFNTDLMEFTNSLPQAWRNYEKSNYADLMLKLSQRSIEDVMNAELIESSYTLNKLIAIGDMGGGIPLALSPEPFFRSLLSGNETKYSKPTMPTGLSTNAVQQITFATGPLFTNNIQIAIANEDVNAFLEEDEDEELIWEDNEEDLD